MVFIATSKATSRKSLSETSMSFKHSFSTPRLQHNLCIPYRILFWQVHLKMNMIASKTKILEFKTKFFEFIKPLDAGVDVRLLPETVIPVLSDKNHRHPVISGVTRNLFRATATYIFQNCTILSCLLECKPAVACRARHILEIVTQKKRYRPFICGPSLHSVHAVFSV